MRLGWPGPAPTKPVGPAGWGKIGTKQLREFVQLDWDDHIIVKLGGVWTVTNLEDLKADLLPVAKKLPAVCPVCGKDEAVVKLDTFHFANIWCEKCQKAFYEAALSPGMFTYKNKLLRVERRAGQFISMEVLEEESFRNKKDDWATHEPASILHEAAIQGNEDAVRFLIDHGADLTMMDYRYQSNAEGWARYGSHDERMADLLAGTAHRRSV